MAAVVRLDLILQAYATRLADIQTANEYSPGLNYRTDVKLVKRGLVNPNKVEETKRPGLFFALLRPTTYQHFPGGLYHGTSSLVTHGYISRKGKTTDEKREQSYNLRADVMAALKEDPQLGGTCIQCLVRDDDASMGRPTDASQDGWIAIVAEILWCGSRLSQ